MLEADGLIRRRQGKDIVLCTVIAFIAMSILADAVYRVLYPRMCNS